MTAVDESNASRRVALAFLSAYWRADLAGVLQLCSDDAMIELPQSIDIATPATMRSVLPGIFGEVYKRFVGAKFDINVERTLAEGDAVLVEYRATGDLTSGRRFDCRYAVVLQVKEERVAVFRQYTDTQYIAAELRI